MADNVAITPGSGVEVATRDDGSGNQIQRVILASPDVLTNDAGGAAHPVKVDAKIALTASAPAAASVGVTHGQVLAANANRRGLVLVNTSTNVISIAFGSSAVLNSGITLEPNGGSFTMDEYTFTTAAVDAIASGGSSNLAIQEFTA